MRSVQRGYVYDMDELHEPYITCIYLEKISTMLTFMNLSDGCLHESYG